MRRGLHVHVLRRARPAALVRIHEAVAVADAEPVVDRHDDEALAREVLVERVVRRVVVPVVIAQQHLAGRAAVHVHHGRMLARSQVAALEELHVDRGAVDRRHDHALGNHQRAGREVRRNPVRAEQPRRAALDGDDRRERRATWAAREQRHRTPVTGHHRAPLEIGAPGELHRCRRIDRDPEEMAAIVIRDIRPRVGVVHHEAPVGRDPHELDHELARREQQRFTAGRRDRVEMGPVVEIGEEDQPIAGAPGQVRFTLGARLGAEQRVGARPRGLRGSARHVHHAQSTRDGDAAPAASAARRPGRARSRTRCAFHRETRPARSPGRWSERATGSARSAR